MTIVIIIIFILVIIYKFHPVVSLLEFCVLLTFIQENDTSCNMFAYVMLTSNCPLINKKYINKNFNV